MRITTPLVPGRLAKGINEFALGKPEKQQQIQNFTKPQQQFQNALLQQLMQLLGGGGSNIQQNPLYQQGSSNLQNLLSGSQESTAAFEAPHLRQFNEQTIPALAERFAGLGAGSSSAFQQALGQAGAGLQENLAALRSGLQFQGLGQALNYSQQPISNLSGLSSIGLQSAFTPFIRPATQGILGGLFGGASQGLGQAGGMAAMAKLLPLLGL